MIGDDAELELLRMLGFPEGEFVTVSPQGDTVSYRGGADVLERAQRYGDRFEQTDDPVEAGKIAAEYMAEAQPREWPLAPWLFDAIAISKGSEPDSPEREALELIVAQFKKITPGAQWLNKHRHEFRAARLPKEGQRERVADIAVGERPLSIDERSVEERLAFARRIAGWEWLRRDLKLARNQATYYAERGRRRYDDGFDRFLNNVRHGGSDLQGAPPRPTRLYKCVRSLIRKRLLEWQDCEGFLNKIEGQRPARLRAMFAALVMKVAVRKVEERTRPAKKSTRVRKPKKD